MKLFHINVVCSDFEKSYAFYTEKLGMVPLTRRRAGVGGGTDGQPATPRPDGRLPGEARTHPQDGEPSAHALGLDGLDMSSRGVLLFWPGTPEGPYLDLLQWYEDGQSLDRTPRQTGLARLALQVEDIDAEYARLKERGVEFMTEPVPITLGATPIKIVFFRDPDGTLLELVEVGGGKGWGN
jgi:catechol 2,3-dioxygenase-like lactoylglutathione lyase family enzyme